MEGVSATERRGATERRLRVAGWLLLTLCCVVALVGASGVAAADDTTPPEWGNATIDRATPTVLNVTFYDNERVDRDSITADDFRLSDGNVSAIEGMTGVPDDANRSGVRVTLTLESPLATDDATLRFQDNGTVVPAANSDGSGEAGIADGEGNALTSGRVDVDFVGNNTSGPEWGTATRAEDTEITVTVYDNIRVDQTSINASDFSLSSGQVESVTDLRLIESGNRSGVAFILVLQDRVDQNNVTVGFAQNGSIVDSDGNELSGGSVVATGMDSVVPDDESYELERVNQSTVRIRLEANERLGGIRMPILGPTDDQLNRSNFTETVGATAVYTATYTVPEEGRYTFVWERATDRHGNFRRMSRTRDFEYDDGHPDIVLDGVENTTVGTAVNFSAADSRATGGVESYQWRIDGGTILTGEYIEVAFAVPGSHEVVVEVTGANGNTSVERRQIQVAPGNDSAVTLSRRNDTYATATVEGSGFLQQVRATNGPVVAGRNVTLDRLSVSFPEGSIVNLTLGVNDAAPASFEESGLGVFTVDHGNVTADQVSFRFGVNRTALNRTDAGPDDVTLYRGGSNWTALNESVVSRDTDRVVYQAESPGLSQFAVGVAGTTSGNETTNESLGNESDDGGDSLRNDSADSNGTAPNEADGSDGTAPNGTTEDGTTNQTESGTTDGTTGESPAPTPAGSADIVVSNVTVNETSPRVGGNVSINVTATNRGTAAGNYSVDVVLNNTTLATHEMAVQPGATTTEEYVHRMPEEGALTVDGRRVANVSNGGGLVSVLPGPVAGIVSAVPNPLSLWPDGIVGTILGGLLGLIVVTYAVLKALAVYLGY